MTEKEILEDLRRFKTEPDDDNIRIKQNIKKKILQDERILYSLHNTSLSIDEPDTFFGKLGNIREYLMVPETQTEPMNYICFKTDTDELANYNEFKKYQQVIFMIMCDERDNDFELVGAARHDVIASLIRENFQLSNEFGARWKLVENKESTTDTHYATRTLVFELSTPSNRVKTENGITRLL